MINVNLKLNFIDLIVVSTYYFFVIFLFLGILGIFSSLSVYITVGMYVALLVLFSKSLTFNRKYLWFFLITCLSSLGFAWLRGYFVGDAYQLWLPAARDLVQGGHFPTFTDNYYFSRMPLLSILMASTFAFFRTLNENINIWIPLFFSSATLIVMWQWAKFRKISSKFIIFVAILFLLNIMGQLYGLWNLLQESLILFFATCFFFYSEKYLKTQQRKYLVILLLSLLLAGASKISGLFLFILVPFILFKAKHKMALIILGILIFLPLLTWLYQIYLEFGNPVYPVLSNFFHGKYYQANELLYEYNRLPDSMSSVWGKYWWTLSRYFWMAYPFIFLALWGFVKKRKFGYLTLIVLFFLIKDAFLFTPNDSSVRYFYPFLGLMIIYALIGIRKINSKIILTILFTLGLAGLLKTEFTNSTSSFISSVENAFSFLGKLLGWLAQYWYVVVALVSVAYYKLTVQKNRAKIVLLATYSLYILHLRFIANKSWLNIWPFILLWLAFVILMALKPKFKYVQQSILALVVLIVFINSYALAAVFTIKQGKFQYPVEDLWWQSKWAQSTMNKLVAPDQKHDFYVLVAAQTGYFTWFSDYQSITLFSRGFFYKLPDYTSDFTAQQLHDYLKENQIRFVVLNETGFGYYPIERESFFDKVNNSILFSLIAQRQGQYKVWQVYE